MGVVVCTTEVRLVDCCECSRPAWTRSETLSSRQQPTRQGRGKKSVWRLLHGEGWGCLFVCPLPCLLLHLWLSLYPTCARCAHRFIKILNLEVECLNFKTYGVFHSAPFRPYTSVICSHSQTWATTISDNFRTYLASPEETSCC